MQTHKGDITITVFKSDFPLSSSSRDQALHELDMDAKF